MDVSVSCMSLRAVKLSWKQSGKRAGLGRITSPNSNPTPNPASNDNKSSPYISPYVMVLHLGYSLFGEWGLLKAGMDKDFAA